MDDSEKKLICQLDDSMAGQRVAALEVLHKHDEKHGTSFRDRVAKIERGEQYDVLEQEAVTLRQQNAMLDGELTQYKAAVGKWQQHATALQAKLAVASAIAWGRTTGRRLAVYAALPVLALVGWQAVERYWPVPAEVDAGLKSVAAGASWRPGCGHAYVQDAGGAPYWVLLCGRTETSTHETAQGEPIGLHCVDLYAHAAEADWQEYVKVEPYGLFGWGWWIKWPRRAVECRPYQMKEAQQ
jgi:hypothetical protein